MAAFKLPSLSLKKRRRQLSLPEFRWNSISLKEELGRGIFGTVYLAKCTGEEQCVVIKKLKGEAADAKRRFEKEAAILWGEGGGGQGAGARENRGQEVYGRRES